MQSEWFTAAVSGDLLFIQQNIEQLKQSTDELFGNKTALMYAASSCKNEIVKFLIPYEQKLQSASGNTALHLAVQNNNLQAVRILYAFEKGIKNNKELTAQQLATEQRKQDIMQLFTDLESNQDDFQQNNAFEGEKEKTYVETLMDYQENLQVQLKKEQLENEQLRKQVEYMNQQVREDLNQTDEQLKWQYKQQENKEEGKLIYLQKELDMIKNEVRELKDVIKQVTQACRLRFLQPQNNQE